MHRRTDRSRAVAFGLNLLVFCAMKRIMFHQVSAAVGSTVDPNSVKPAVYLQGAYAEDLDALDHSSVD